MVYLDITMPENCKKCPFFEEDVCHIDGKYAISESQAETKPQWCPLKENVDGVDLEEMRRSIQADLFSLPKAFNKTYWDGVDDAANVVDLHMKKSGG